MPDSDPAATAKARVSLSLAMPPPDRPTLGRRLTRIFAALGVVGRQYEPLAAEAVGGGELAAVRQLGNEGEAAAGILKNTLRIPSASGNASYRIPDVLDHAARLIGDVKNVARLSRTSQLRDYLAYAQTNHYEFHLWGAKARYSRVHLRRT